MGGTHALATGKTVFAGHLATIAFPHGIRWSIAALLFLLAGLLHQAVAADPPPARSDGPPPVSQRIQGKVTAIVDGDTLHLTADGVVYLVDLAGIDAPEKGQPSGDMAAQVLHLKVMQKDAQLLVLPQLSSSPAVQPIVPAPEKSAQSGRNPPGGRLRARVRGILYYDGCVNRQLVHEGVAWHDPTGCPSAALAREQESARGARRGLWQAESPPVPPWQWRQQQSKMAADGASALQAEPIKDLSRFFEADSPPAVAEAGFAIPPEPASPAAAAAPTLPASPSAGDYWLTESSGIRHNSACRYYKKSKGRPCAAGEGQPCKKCGG